MSSSDSRSLISPVAAGCSSGDSDAGMDVFVAVVSAAVAPAAVVAAVGDAGVSPLGGVAELLTLLELPLPASPPPDCVPDDAPPPMTPIPPPVWLGVLLRLLV